MHTLFLYSANKEPHVKHVKSFVQFHKSVNPQITAPSDVTHDLLFVLTADGVLRLVLGVVFGLLLAVILLVLFTFIIKRCRNRRSRVFEVFHVFVVLL